MGEPAGGRAWQVGARPGERSVVRADGSASAARRPWGAARAGGGEGRRGAWRREGAPRGVEEAARAHRPPPTRPPARRVTDPRKGGSLGGNAGASTHLARTFLGALRLCPVARLPGSLAGGREGGSAARVLACLPSTSAVSFCTFGRIRRRRARGPAGVHAASLVSASCTQVPSGSP